MAKTQKNKPKVIFKDLENKFLFITVGEQRTDYQDIMTEVARLDNQLTDLFEEHGVNCMVLVAPYFVDAKLIESKT